MNVGSSKCKLIPSRNTILQILSAIFNYELKTSKKNYLKNIRKKLFLEAWQRALK